MAKEKNFENKVKKFLKNNGCYSIKYWGGGQFTKAGVPDLLVCCNGRFLGIEIKADNGKPSELQLHNLNEIEKAGGFGILLYPSQWERFTLLIESLERFDVQSTVGCYDVFRAVRVIWEERLGNATQ